MTPKEIAAQDTANAIIRELRSRGGFDDIFGNLDHETLRDIQDTISEIIYTSYLVIE